MENLPISPWKINLSTKSSPVGLNLFFKLKGGKVQKQKTLVALLFTNLFQNQGSEFPEQLRMPCKLCLNSAVTHKAAQTPTCANYCNLHLRLTQTSHASKRQTAGRPRGGGGTSHSSLAAQPSSGYWQDLSPPGCSSDVRCSFSGVRACTSSLFSLQPFGRALKRWQHPKKKKVSRLPHFWKYLTKHPCLCFFPPTLIFSYFLSFFPHSANKQMLFALQTSTVSVRWSQIYRRKTRKKDGDKTSL